MELSAIPECAAGFHTMLPCHKLEAEGGTLSVALVLLDIFPDSMFAERGKSQLRHNLLLVSYAGEMPSIRLPRFRRASVNMPLVLTPRDREIVRLTHRYRFVRSSHLVALLGVDSRHVLRRLQLLYHHGYLERPRAQIDYFHQGGSKPIVYGLGNKGAALLKKESDIFPSPFRWGPKNRAVGRLFLEHALLVAECMVALELACRANGNVRLLLGHELGTTSQTAESHFRWKVQLPGGVKSGLIPDKVFALDSFDDNGRSIRQYFFLEADRGTMPVVRKNLQQTSMLRKFLGYAATWSQNLHQKEFGFHRFRVLTITPSKDRLNNLVDTCSTLERGHGLFLFAPCDVLTSPEHLFEVALQTGKPGVTSTLLD